VRALAPTRREPQRDIEAQFAALIDPKHPKKTMWVSLGTPIPDMAGYDGLEAVNFGAGVLIAGHEDVLALQQHPCEEVLAMLLGLVAPKSSFAHRQEQDLFVAQARHPVSGAVILEMVIDNTRIRSAISRCRRYGEPVVLTMADCLRRRATLLMMESAHDRG